MNEPVQPPLRVGVIGCGAIARRRHIPLLTAAGARVTAFASQTRRSAAEAAAQAGGGAVFDTWQDLLASDEVDAVTICAPNVVHVEAALAAIDVGKHVLVEKPVTTTVRDADRLVAAASTADVVAMVAHDARFLPPIVAIGEAIRSDRIGAVTSVAAWLGHAGPQAWSPGSTWFEDAGRSGGGALLDLGVHLVDTVRWLLTDEFTDVSCVLGRDRELPVESDASVVFRTAAGVNGTLQASWRCVAGADVGIIVRGTKGLLAFDGTATTLRSLDGTVETVAPSSDVVDSPQAAFVRAIGGGASARPDLADGRAAVAVAEACYAAARTGRRAAVAV